MLLRVLNIKLRNLYGCFQVDIIIFFTSLFSLLIN